MQQESGITQSFARSRVFYYSMLAFWFVLNLLQSRFTELLHDEAYYYFYSLDLAWGYYDHPPVIALLIKSGTALFDNELGVRFFISLMSVATLALLVKMAKVRNYLLFFTLLFSVFIIHAGGFIAVPDIPLIFFTALFLYFYKNYMERNSWLDVLLVSLAIAGALYSKYLGLLVVVFTFVSNPTLLRRKTFWVIVLLSASAMVPHLIWQVNHNYPSIYFHLVERSRNSYFGWMNIINYLLGQVVLLNPLVAFFFLYFAFKLPAKNLFTRALKFNVYGIMLFGLLLTFLGPVEANWTVAAYIPVIVLAYPAIEKKSSWHKAAYMLSAVSILIIVVLRLYLVLGVPSQKSGPGLQKEFHGWDVWADEVEKIAGDRPVVFASSYQLPSKYVYYAGKESFTFNYMRYRKNQFDLENIETKLMDRKVLFMNPDPVIILNDEIVYRLPRVDSTLIMGRWWYYSAIKHYRSYNFLPLKIGLTAAEFPAGSEIEIPIELMNPLNEPLTIEQEEGDSWLTVSFVRHGTVILYEEVEDISNLTINKSYQTVLHTKVPAEPGKYNLWVSIRSGWLPPGLNSRLYKLEVTGD
ncbi:MAG: glycosyltransferase family 39 protein [Bacteroidales bacterium]|nr:glycosyltransferase family 39 protein [Bacteroidales bacterium]